MSQRQRLSRGVRRGGDGKEGLLRLPSLRSGLMGVWDPFLRLHRWRKVTHLNASGCRAESCAGVTGEMLGVGDRAGGITTGFTRGAGSVWG